MPLPLVNYLALALVAGGLISFAAVFASTGRWREGLKAGLDLWLAAGLLRLTAPPSWSRLGIAACIVLIRKMVGVGLRSAFRARA